MSALPQDHILVPLKIDGVVVGRILVNEDNVMRMEITAPGTSPYLKEMIILGLIQAVSLDIDYVEPPQNHVPLDGHLRLTGSSNGNEEAEANPGDR